MAVSWDAQGIRSAGLSAINKFKNTDVKRYGGIFMTRDMDLVRKILLTIEERYVDVALYDLEIEGSDMKTVAYHCYLLHQAGLIKAYKGQYADDELYSFGVGALTWEGHDFLDKIRSDTVWNKTKSVIKDKGLPLIIETVREISSAIITGMMQGVLKSS